MNNQKVSGPLFSASGYAKLAVAAAFFAFGSLIGMLVGVDGALQSGFTTAFTHDETRLKQDLSGNTGAGDGAANSSYAGSEDFWLGHAKRTNTVPVSLGGASGFGDVGVGDTMTISTPHGDRLLKIERISALPVRAPGTVGTDGTQSADQKQSASVFVLTARELGRSNGLVMRILVEELGSGQLSLVRPEPGRDS